VARDVTRHRLLDEILSFFGGRALPMMAQLAEAGKLTLRTCGSWRRRSKKRKGSGIEMTNHLVAIDFVRGMAGLATLAFRKNRAQVRYWLWFSASFKFSSAGVIDESRKPFRMVARGESYCHAGCLVCDRAGQPNLFLRRSRLRLQLQERVIGSRPRSLRCGLADLQSSH